MDLVVFIDGSATQADIDRFENEFASSNRVEEHNYVTQADAFAELQALFAETDAVRDAVEQDQVPTRFELWIVDPTEQDVGELQTKYDDDPLVLVQDVQPPPTARTTSTRR